MTDTNQILLLNNLLQEEVQKYQGLTTKDISENFGISVASKNINHVIFSRIIDSSKNKETIKRLINECNCIIKTVNLEWNNSLKESMSLNAFKYEDIFKEEWETSTLRAYFTNHCFVFVVFKKDFNGSKLEKVKVWNMPASILESGVKETWELTKKLICQGKIVNYIDSRGRYITYFPTSSETKYLHVRPHAQNRNDTLPLPVCDNVTQKKSFMKHSFWLNSNFIRKIVVDDKYYE